MTPSSDTVEIEGIDTDHVTAPRNDGTAGSGLYAVGIKLKQTPSPKWARLFPDNWDRPREWSTMHRPGIARVLGDRIVLDGTTIEEVRDVHVKTLKIAVEMTNEQAAELAERARAQRAQAAKEQAEHAANVQSVAADIKF
jgi:hypothetical protein